MQASDLAIAESSANNILLDALVKFGIVGAITAIAALVVAVALTVPAMRVQAALPFGLLGTYGC